MAFSSRRGRPKTRITAETVDRGTPELQRRRRAHQTAEPLDLLHLCGDITPNEHWAGIHFRWLYTLRYGSPTPQSLDPAHVKGLAGIVTDENRQHAAEQEWKNAITVLTNYRLLPIIINVCIHNNTPKSIHAKQRLIPQIKQGLELLAALWIRPKHKAIR